MVAGIEYEVGDIHMEIDTDSTLHFIRLYGIYLQQNLEYLLTIIMG